jgi:TrpR-related protein YerC/YecD
MGLPRQRQGNLMLYETILTLRSPEECRRFFEDLCTPVEMRAMEQRFEVAIQLQQGKVYTDILERTGASSATISRVRRFMLEGGAGGVMQDVICRMTTAESEGNEIS